MREKEDVGMYYIPSLKLTYPLQIDRWKRRFLLETIIFWGYVSFREGIWMSFHRTAEAQRSENPKR